MTIETVSRALRQLRWGGRREGVRSLTARSHVTWAARFNATWGRETTWKKRAVATRVNKTVVLLIDFLQLWHNDSYRLSTTDCPLSISCINYQLLIDWLVICSSPNMQWWGTPGVTARGLLRDPAGPTGNPTHQDLEVVISAGSIVKVVQFIKNRTFSYSLTLENLQVKSNSTRCSNI
jgi:hypothetical protein